MKQEFNQQHGELSQKSHLFLALVFHATHQREVETHSKAVLQKERRATAV